MAYQLKITLMHSSDPVVWRRVRFDSDSDFDDLHAAIQGAFGWEMAHLWEFTPTLGRSNVAIIMPELENDYLVMEDREVMEADMVDLNEYFQEPGDKMYYLYDFGDSWMHEIVLEGILPDEEHMFETPQVVEGKGACPPEDCGGVGGYDWLKKVLADPNHEEHEHYREWMDLENGEAFDPNEFDLEETQEEIDTIFNDLDFFFDPDDEDEEE